MKIKVSEASGVVLDWLVAKCEGIPTAEFVALQKLPKTDDFWKYQHSTDWAQGGPIIERMFESGLQLTKIAGQVRASLDTPNGFYYGPTPLIAAMRCYVASKLGAVVEVPDELSS